MGIYVKLVAALATGVTAAALTAAVSARELSPDNQVAAVIQEHLAGQPDVVDYGGR